jgi:CRP/FNR family transcriptional regulator, cyclic AMP receptor protein
MESTAPVIALLEKTELFGPVVLTLSAADRHAFSARFRPTDFRSGHQIFARGTPGDYLLLVAEGRIRLSIVAEDGRELSVRHATAGDIIGEMSVFDGGLRSADAAALSTVRAFVLHQADARRMLTEFPALASGIIAFLCGRLRQTTEQLEGIALYPIEVRLARFLLVALGGRKAEPGKRVPLELGFSQTELAQLLGASRPKVNGALGLLEEAGALKRTADRLFCDPALLGRYAGLFEDE